MEKSKQVMVVMLDVMMLFLTFRGKRVSLKIQTYLPKSSGFGISWGGMLTVFSRVFYRGRNLPVQRERKKYDETYRKKDYKNIK